MKNSGLQKILCSWQLVHTPFGTRKYSVVTVIFIGWQYFFFIIPENKSLGLSERPERRLLDSSIDQQVEGGCTFLKFQYLQRICLQ